MSKIGKKPIQIPADVSVAIEERKVTVRGPKGELNFILPKEIKAILGDNQLALVPAIESKKMMALWGTSRAVIANLIKGAKEGFEKKLEIEGVGFRAEIKGNDLVLALGFSHPVTFTPPEGIQIKIEKNVMTISGISKELVGQVAADIRAFRKPEPYKGKGIRYQGEVIRRKVGKKVAGTTG